VLGALTADLGYTREQIGKIDLNEFATYVAVVRDIAAEAVARLNEGRIKGRRNCEGALAEGTSARRSRRAILAGFPIARLVLQPSLGARPKAQAPCRDRTLHTDLLRDQPALQELMHAISG
jgi:hypothetical protein